MINIQQENDPRISVEVRCIQMFREQNHLSSDDEAVLKFIEEGYVERFSRVYKPGLDFSVLYHEFLHAS